METFLCRRRKELKILTLETKYKLKEEIRRCTDFKKNNVNHLTNNFFYCKKSNKLNNIVPVLMIPLINMI